MVSMLIKFGVGGAESTFSLDLRIKDEDILKLDEPKILKLLGKCEKKLLKSEESRSIHLMSKFSEPLPTFLVSLN